MKRVVFYGRAHQLPNDSMKADPVPGLWYVGERPQHIPDAVPCFTEKIFDRALAESCGRTCGPDCDGDCFAELYVAVANLNDAQVSGRQKNEHLFDCLPCDPALTTFTAFLSDLPPSVTEPSAPQPAPKPPRRAALAAKE